jgi:hypothetical protein
VWPYTDRLQIESILSFSLSVCFLLLSINSSVSLVSLREKASQSGSRVVRRKKVRSEKTLTLPLGSKQSERKERSTRSISLFSVLGFVLVIKMTNKAGRENRKGDSFLMGRDGWREAFSNNFVRGENRLCLREKSTRVESQKVHRLIDPNPLSC